jgi:flagellar basal body rod protein FlgG
MNNNFQNMVITAQDLRQEAKEYGINLNINGDGTITFYHGTSLENATKIMQEGFFEETYFSHDLNITGYCDESPMYYATIKNKDGVVLRANIDCKYIDFASGTGEFLLNAHYKPEVCVICS